MTAYIIVDTKIHDADAYEEYKRLARPIAEKHGGEYIVRGGDIALIESDLWTPSRMVVIRFPSRAVAEAFVEDPEYAPVKAKRHAAAQCTLMIVDGF